MKTRRMSKMSPPVRNDNCSIQKAGNSTTNRIIAAVALTSQRELFIALLFRIEPADQPAKQQHPTDHQRRNRAAVAPIGKIERLDKRVIVGDLGDRSGPTVCQNVDQREGLDAVD